MVINTFSIYSIPIENIYGKKFEVKENRFQVNISG